MGDIEDPTRGVMSIACERFAFLCFALAQRCLLVQVAYVGVVPRRAHRVVAAGLCRLRSACHRTVVKEAVQLIVDARGRVELLPVGELGQVCAHRNG